MEVVEKDGLDRILEQWAEERPDLDASPMGVFGRLSRAEKLLERSLSGTFRRFGLVRGEFDVLGTLRRSGDPYSLTPTELYRSTMLSSGAMTNRLDRLEERGLVRRSPDPGDRRGVLITLTEEGLGLIEEAVGAHVEGEEELLGALSGEDREQLACLLRKLLSSMEGAGSGETKPSGALRE
jgi:DNA-binding MarR family transcriptional regulator